MTKNFYVVELTSCILRCGDTGFWTHASPNLDELKKFVEDLSYSLKSPILKLKVQLFQTVSSNNASNFYQWSASCNIDLIANSDDYTLKNNQFLLKHINDYLAIVYFENDKADKKIQKKLKNSFKELWAYFDENLKGLHG